LPVRDTGGPGPDRDEGGLAPTKVHVEGHGCDSGSLESPTIQGRTSDCSLNSRDLSPVRDDQDLVPPTDGGGHQGHVGGGLVPDHEGRGLASVRDVIIRVDVYGYN
jgi:hypothetical protein